MPKLNEIVLERIDELLSKAEKINFETLFAPDDERLEAFRDIRFYLIDKKIKDEIALLEAGVRGLESREDAKDPLWHYLKLINKEHPAYKYNFFVKKRSQEIFDREKVRQRIEGEVARYVNRERSKLKKKIEQYDPPLSEEERTHLESNLENRIEIQVEKMKEVLDNFDEYDVVITNHAHSSLYPSLYYTLSTKEGKGYQRQDSTHLRAEVPNLLWYEENKPFKEYRADMKIEEIIQNFTPYCDTIYIKKRN